LPWAMKARTNISLFYGLYDDIQVPSTVFIPSPLGTGMISIGATQNAAQGHIEGIDSEITLLPTDSVELHFNFAYTLDKYDTYVNKVTGADESGLPFPVDPASKFN